MMKWVRWFICYSGALGSRASGDWFVTAVRLPIHSCNRATSSLTRPTRPKWPTWATSPPSSSIKTMAAAHLPHYATAPPSRPPSRVDQPPETGTPPAPVPLPDQIPSISPPHVFPSETVSMNAHSLATDVNPHPGPPRAYKKHHHLGHSSPHPFQSTISALPRSVQHPDDHHRPPPHSSVAGRPCTRWDIGFNPLWCSRAGLAICVSNNATIGLKSAVCAGQVRSRPIFLAIHVYLAVPSPCAEILGPSLRGEPQPSSRVSFSFLDEFLGVCNLFDVMLHSPCSAFFGLSYLAVTCGIWSTRSVVNLIAYPFTTTHVYPSSLKCDCNSRSIARGLQLVISMTNVFITKGFATSAVTLFWHVMSHMERQDCTKLWRF